MKKYLTASLMFFLAGAAAAEEVITIESRITGSQEQPKVISIVPWQSPGEPEYFDQEIEGIGMSDNAFEPIDRDAFIRELRYISATRK